MILNFSNRLLHFFQKHQVFINRLEQKNNIYFPANAVVERFTCFYQGDNVFSMGAFSYSFSSQIPGDLFSVGRYCSIAENLKIMGHHHPIDYLTTSTALYAPSSQVNPATFQKNFQLYEFPERDYGPIVVGNDVWIGSDVLLKGGINIGTGSVIAAGSVVVKDVPPYAIVGGNPARIIRFRFDESLVKDLLEIKWWEYNIYDFSNLDMKKPKKFVDDFVRLEKSFDKLKSKGLSREDLSEFL